MEFLVFLRLIWGKKLRLIGVPLLVGMVFYLAQQAIPVRYESTAVIVLRDLNYYPWVHAYDQEVIKEDMVYTGTKLLDSNGFMLELIKTLPFETDLAALHADVKIDNLSNKSIRVRAYSDDSEKSSVIVNGVLNILPAKMKELYGCEVLVLERPTGPGRRYFQDVPLLSLGLVMGVALLWTLSLVMLKTNQAWE